jgi:hypothetical protein
MRSPPALEGLKPDPARAESSPKSKLELSQEKGVSTRRRFFPGENRGNYDDRELQSTGPWL